jgi:hypothetical protein
MFIKFLAVMRPKAEELNLFDLSPDRTGDEMSFIRETSYDHSIAEKDNDDNSPNQRDHSGSRSIRDGIRQR